MLGGDPEKGYVCWLQKKDISQTGSGLQAEMIQNSHHKPQ